MTGIILPHPAIYAVAQGLAYGLFLLVITTGGNLFCGWLLRGTAQSPPAPTTGDTVPSPKLPSGGSDSGRYIGNLERTIIMMGLIAGSWDILAVVIALKTVARYQELDKQIQAEYFLIGSLGSVAWAIAMSVLLMWYDQTLGMHFVSALRSFVPLQR